MKYANVAIFANPKQPNISNLVDRCTEIYFRIDLLTGYLRLIESSLKISYDPMLAQEIRHVEHLLLILKNTLFRNDRPAIKRDSKSRYIN